MCTGSTHFMSFGTSPNLKPNLYTICDVNAIRLCRQFSARGSSMMPTIRTYFSLTDDNNTSSSTGCMEEIQVMLYSSSGTMFRSALSHAPNQHVFLALIRWRWNVNGWNVNAICLIMAGHLHESIPIAAKLPQDVIVDGPFTSEET